MSDTRTLLVESLRTLADQIEKGEIEVTEALALIPYSSSVTNPDGGLITLKFGSYYALRGLIEFGRDVLSAEHLTAIGDKGEKT